MSRVPKLAWMSAEAVADEAVRGVGRGPILVNGMMNSVLTTALRFVPRSLVTRSVAAMLRPPGA